MTGRRGSAWAEVVAVYRGTPIDVQHVGRPAPARWGVWLGLGAGALGLGVALLASELRHDWAAHAEAAAAAEERGELRLASPGHGLAGVGAMLVLLGLVPLVLGLVRAGERRRRDCWIGEAHAAAFVVPGPERVLVDADGPTLCFTADMQGEARVGGVRRSLAWLIEQGAARFDGEVYRWPLLGGSRCRVVHGEVTFWVRAVAPGVPALARGGFDMPVAPHSAVALAVFGGILWLSHLVPRDEWIDLEDPTDELKFVGYVRRASAAPQVARVAERAHEAAPGDAAVESDRVPPRRGAPRVAARRGKGPPAVGGMIGLDRGFDPEGAARRAGILGLMHGSGAPATGVSAGYLPGGDDEDVWTGAPVHEAYGGLGLIGSGRGGGSGEGTIGLGRRWGGCGCVDTPDRPRRRLTLGDVEVAGGLERDVIRRVLRAHHHELTQCVGREDPPGESFYRSLDVHFSLAADGSVRNAVPSQVSTIDAARGRCIAEKIRGWGFPGSEDGSLTLITATYEIHHRGW